jgi:hypothetical protein
VGARVGGKVGSAGISVGRGIAVLGDGVEGIGLWQEVRRSMPRRMVEINTVSFIIIPICEF